MSNPQQDEFPADSPSEEESSEEEESAGEKQSSEEEESASEEESSEEEESAGEEEYGGLLPCPVCPEVFADEFALDAHLENLHRHIVRFEMHICPFCMMVYADSNEMMAHQTQCQGHQ